MIPRAPAGQEPHPRRRGHRFWIPGGILIFMLIGLGTAKFFFGDLDSNIKAWLVGMVLLLALVLMLGWFLFLSRFGWRLRLTVAGILALATISLSQMLRINGTTDGRGLPRLAWKWSTPTTIILPKASGTPPIAAPAVPPALADVPQFLGPNRDGKVTGMPLATNWTSSPPRQLWRQPIGAAWSGFAVVGGRAFTQEQRGDDECITCYDVLTGQLLWSYSYPARFSQWQSGDGPHATPTVQEGRVFAYGATGILNCLNASNGSPIWSHHVLEENGLKNLQWGTSASPLVVDDLVVVTGGQSLGPTVLAYERRKGELRWRSGTDRASYSSPVAARLAGRKVVVSFNAATLTVHDLATGEMLLEHRWGGDGSPKAAQPVLLDEDRVFVTAGYGMGCEMLQVRPREDGKLTARSLWKNMRLKAQFNSIAVRDGYLYGLDDGMLACVDAASGTRRWKEARFGSGQTLLADDLILVQGEGGPIALCKASPDACRELGRIPALSSKTWNHPTLAGRYLLVRNDREAVCYELPVIAVQ
jgi:outer membrane protein assembly factor BamB